MSPTVANFLFEAANLLLLMLGLAWFGFRPVRAALDAERARHAKLGEEASKARTEAEELSAQARASRDEARRLAEARRTEILAGAREEAASVARQAEQDREHQRRAFEREQHAAARGQVETIGDAVGLVASESVRRLLAVIDGPALDRALVGAASEQLRALPASARDGALVETARPLDPEARTLLAEWLGNAASERLVPELGAGVRVTTSAGLVDASARAIAAQAARALADAVRPEEPAQSAASSPEPPASWPRSEAIHG